MRSSRPPINAVAGEQSRLIKMAEHGGKRVGAGRTKGALTKRTRLIAEKAAEQGITPLEVMLGNMRYFHKLAEGAEAVLADLSADKIAGMEPDARFKYLLAEVKKAAGLRDMAHTCARDAAPYLHPRLASIEQALRGGLTVQYAISDKPMSNEEWIATYYATPETEH
jgi:hypothetical protein